MSKLLLCLKINLNNDMSNDIESKSDLPVGFKHGLIGNTLENDSQ